MQSSYYPNELFALHIEHEVAKQFGYVELFDQKMSSKIHPKMRTIFERYSQHVQSVGDFITMCELGFPKLYEPQTIISTLKRIYSSAVDSIELAILYGSQKPYSDIDIFIVSDVIRSETNDWLDIFVRNKSQFQTELENLLLPVVDPLFSGTLLIGEGEYLEKLKAQTQSRKIDSKMIAYNLAYAEWQDAIFNITKENLKLREKAKFFRDTLRAHSQLLTYGQKTYTLKELLKKISITTTCAT
jgi:predicted nucleotidyltransferase